MSPTPSLYDPFFTPAERQALQAIPWNDLSGEIKAIRSRAALLIEIGQAPSASGDLELNASLLTTLSLAFGQLASLVSTQMKEHVPLAAIESEREAGIRMARSELGLLTWEGSPDEEEQQIVIEKERQVEE